MPTLSLPDAGPAHGLSKADWRLTSAQGMLIGWSAALLGATALWALVVGRLPANAEPHLT